MQTEPIKVGMFENIEHIILEDRGIIKIGIFENNILEDQAIMALLPKIHKYFQG